MALEEIPDPDFSNLWNLFKRPLWAKLIDRANLWAHMRVNTGGSARGTAKFIVTEEASVLDLSKFTPSVVTYHPLTILNATAGGVAKVLITPGSVAGRPAVAGMVSPGYELTLTVNGTRYIYCEVTWGYSAPVWESSACTLIEDTTAMKPSTSTKQYVYIGSAVREIDGSGGFRVGAIYNDLSGSQGASRIAYGSIISDKNWLI